MEVLTIKQKEKNREGNILVRRGGKEYRGKRRIIFGQQGQRRTEEEKGTIFGEGKCLEKENSFFCGGEEEQRRKI